jgi:hypothetical protein
MARRGGSGRAARLRSDEGAAVGKVHAQAARGQPHVRALLRVQRALRGAGDARQRSAAQTRRQRR